MAFSLFMCGFSHLIDGHVTSFFFQILFICSFNFSVGSMSWFYVAEVTIDTATGFALAGQFVSLAVMSLTVDMMINSEVGITGVIFYLSVWSIFGTIFCDCSVRESRGLTDIEKKSLYAQA